MLSIPDIKHKQILFIQTEKNLENKFKLQNDNLILEKEGKITNKISVHRLLAVFIIGDFSFTSKIIEKLLSFGVSIFFLKRNLKKYATIEAFAEANFLVRQRQYTILQAEELELAKKIIYQKVENQRKLLLEKGFKLQDLNEFKIFKNNIKKATNEKELLGIEGNAAKSFFTNYFGSSNMNWLRRQPQIKFDIPNLLLDIGYSYLFNFTDSLLRLYGFDTYKGFYHKLYFERKSLACDIMEVFRYFVDKAILKAYNLNQVDEKDFSYKNFVYTLKYKQSVKYSQMFLKVLMENKVEILKYIQAYYRYFMRPDKYEFPKIKHKN
jgi:CRISPR-associated protein Cas1